MCRAHSPNNWIPWDSPVLLTHSPFNNPGKVGRLKTFNSMIFKKMFSLFFNHSLFRQSIRCITQYSVYSGVVLDLQQGELSNTVSRLEGGGRAKK